MFKPEPKVQRPVVNQGDGNPDPRLKEKETDKEGPEVMKNKERRKHTKEETGKRLAGVGGSKYLISFHSSKGTRCDYWRDNLMAFAEPDVCGAIFEKSNPYTWKRDGIMYGRSESWDGSLGNASLETTVC